jgi:hypothetical protein
MYFLYSNQGCFAGTYFNLDQDKTMPKWRLANEAILFPSYGKAHGAITEMRRDGMDFADQLCIDQLPVKN